MVQQRIKLVSVHRHDLPIHWHLLLFCCEPTVIILEKEKEKCGISNEDAERQVARHYKKNASKNATLFPFLLAPIPQGKRPE